MTILTCVSLSNSSHYYFSDILTIVKLNIETHVVYYFLEILKWMLQNYFFTNSYLFLEPQRFTRENRRKSTCKHARTCNTNSTWHCGVK